MTLLFWRVLCGISAVLSIALIICMLVMRLLKNHYYQEYQENELIKREKSENSDNAVYFTTGETNKYIKKYVLCKTLYDKYLVCNFASNFREITYFVVQYTAKKKVKAVLKINELRCGDASKVIALDKRCAYVNVIAAKVDSTELNTDFVRPLSLGNIRIYSFMRSFALFLGLFALQHILVELVAGSRFIDAYLSNICNYAAILASLVFAVAAYFISVKCYRKKNTKGLNGGALEYDFL